MRKVAAAALAVPVFALLYVPLALRRRLALRAGILLGLAAVIGVGTVAIDAAHPAATTAQRPRPILPVPAAVLRTDLRTGQAPDASVQIAFSEPMNRGSVRAALDVRPASAIRADWNADGTVLTVSPLGRWGTGTYYTITVAPGALSAGGVPLTTPTRAVFLTRPATSATIRASAVTGDRVRVDTAFVVDFDGPIDPATLPGALHLDPPVAGAWARTGGDATASRWTFTPLGRLAPDTTYRVTLGEAVRDVDGAKIEVAPVEVRTPAAPRVVRFRPVDATTGVDRGATLSVRFSEAMEREATASAFSASLDGKPLKGAVTWAEGDTVLVFDPAANFDYAQTIVMQLGRTATSAVGVRLAEEAKATFTTEERPAPPAPPRIVAPPSGGGGSGGSSVGSGSWTAVESYYLRLMNCTRTGGLVTSSGSCSSPGGRNVAPLMLDSGISAKVARPYAKLLATRGACDHFIGGNPGDRLRRAGYTSYIWAENLGCRSGDPYAAVLGSHLYFQGERSWSPQGGHYVNLMNTKYDRAGIGVWVYAGRVRLVVDFYHPL